MKRAGEGLTMMIFCEKVDAGGMVIAKELQMVERAVYEIVNGGGNSVADVTKLVKYIEETVSRG
jgi:hypothetical protein